MFGWKYLPLGGNIPEYFLPAPFIIPIWKNLFGVLGVWPGLLYVHFVKITIEILQNIDTKWTQITHTKQK
jgi:hypothetical protein